MKSAVFIAIAICFVTVCGGYPAPSWAESTQIPTLGEWASAQPRQYSPDGREIPFSGTPYFRQYHPEGSEAMDTGRGGARWAPVLRINGTFCRIFVDAVVGSQFNDTNLQKLVTEFDMHIWPVDTDVFGTPGCSTIDIYIYPIDGPGSVGGYFNGGFALYLDSSDTSWMDEILTHEFQHCIHNQKDSREDLWVNEGCADMAIQLCYGFFNNTSSLSSHIKFFESNPNNDLTVFQNQLYDYGSAYAFLSYFHEQFGGNSTIKALVADKARGITGFSNRLAGTGQNFNGVFRNWTVANYMNNRTIDPAYGYVNLSVKAGTTRVSAYPFSSNGTVQRWASEYYNFTADGSDLELDFNGSASAPLEVYLGSVGKGSVPSRVQKMMLDASRDGFATVPRLGIDYSQVVMVVSSSTASGNFSLTANAYDRTPPITQINVTPPLPNYPDGWYSAPPNITLTTNEKRCSIFYRWDNETVRPYTWWLTAPEGRHTIHFWSRDAVGNEEEERSLVIKVDTTPPLTELSVQPPLPDGRSGWYCTIPSLELSGEVGARITYSWDGGPQINYSTLLRPAEGVHTIVYRSADAHGNAELDRMATFKVDTLAPSFGLYINPAAPDGLNGWYLRPPTMQLETEPGAELFYRWNSEGLTRYQGPLTGREGQNLLTYYAMDQAGNHESPRELDINVDTTIPRCEAIILPAEPDGLNDFFRSNVSIVLSSEPDATIQYRWDHGNWVSYFGAIVAPEGYHALSFFANDEAGNPSAEGSLELRVDTVPPETVLTIDPDIGGLWYTEAPAILLATSPDAVAYYSLDGGQQREYNGRIPLSSGGHRLCFWGADMAGNEGVRPSRSLRLDLEDPTAAILFPAPYALEGQGTFFDGSASRDGQSGVVEYRFIYGDGEESGWTSSPLARHSYARAGVYKASLTVRDAAGRESAQCELSVTVNALGTYGGDPLPSNPGPASALAAAGAAVALILALSIVVWVRGRRLGKARGAGPKALHEDNLKRRKGVSNTGKRGP